MAWQIRKLFNKREIPFYYNNEVAYMVNLDAQKTAVYFIWIVGIVAVLGAFLVFLN